MRGGLFIAGLCTGFFILAACTPSAAIKGNEGNLVDQVWVLTELMSQNLVQGSSITIQFTSDGKTSGSAGCNRYAGTYTTTGSTLTISSPLAVTRMVCAEDVMNQEAAYLEALAQVKTYTITGDRLTLSDASSASVLVFIAQSQDLAGTAWDVLSYNNGKQAVTSVLAGTAITVQFGKDGTVSGNSGCNSYGGSYKVTGKQIEVGPLASTMMYCTEPAGLMDQEAQYLAALQTAAVYGVEGTKLELRTSEGALAVQAIASVSTPIPEATVPGNSFEEIIWQWITLTNRTTGETTTIPDPENYTITFHANGTLDGKADCNAFGGTYTQENGFHINLGPSTMAYCGDDSLDQQYLSLLSSIVAGGPDGAGGFALETAGGEQRMLFENGGITSE